jgi:hypothetical protein
MHAAAGFGVHGRADDHVKINGPLATLADELRANG